MARIISLCAVGLLVAASPPVAGGKTVARIQDASTDICWSPDHEWPVPCGEE